MADEKGLDFTGLDPEDVEKVFRGLPEEERVQKLIELLFKELDQTAKVSEVLAKLGKYTGIAIQLLTRLV